MRPEHPLGYFSWDRLNLDSQSCKNNDLNPLSVKRYIRTLGRRHTEDRWERLGVIGHGRMSQKESS